MHLFSLSLPLRCVRTIVSYMSIIDIMCVIFIYIYTRNWIIHTYYIYCYIMSHMYDHVPKMMIICTFHSIVHGTPTAKKNGGTKPILSRQVASKWEVQIWWRRCGGWWHHLLLSKWCGKLSMLSGVFFERIVGDLKKRDKARPPKKKEGKQVPKSRQLNYFSIFLAGARMELIWDWIRSFDNQWPTQQRLTMFWRFSQRPKILISDSSQLCGLRRVTNIAMEGPQKWSPMEAMAHRNRWFTWVYLLKVGGFSMAMLNNQMVAGH